MGTLNKLAEDESRNGTYTIAEPRRGADYMFIFNDSNGLESTIKFDSVEINRNVIRFSRDGNETGTIESSEELGEVYTWIEEF